MVVGVLVNDLCVRPCGVVHMNVVRFRFLPMLVNVVVWGSVRTYVISASVFLNTPGCLLCT